MRLLSIYIHIPFCVQKCRYCDFLSAPSDENTRFDYISALKREIVKESRNYCEYEVVTVFFGGGTPSILDAAQINEVLAKIRGYYRLAANAEITLELNPGTASYEKLCELKAAGINRLSIGLQSTWNEELKMLGRIHTYEEFCKIYDDARKAGFDNINIDMMSALPGQTIDKWRYSLERILELKPEHISAYSLIIEEGTYLYDHLENFPYIPTEEDDRMMYQETKRILKEHGYERYEISNYARPGYESRHNSVYWTLGDYVGFGLGASSFIDNVRWKNTDILRDYIRGDFDYAKEEVEKISAKDSMAEYMFLGLRMMKGVSKSKFFKLFGKSMDEVYGEVIEKWSSTGHLVIEGDTVRLSDEGIDISNQIFADYI